MISNITLEPYLMTYIIKAFSSLELDIQAVFVSYEELNQKQIELYNADIVSVCLNFEAMYPNAEVDTAISKAMADDIMKDVIQKCQKLYHAVKYCSKAHILWFGFEDYYVNCDIIYGAVPMLSGAVEKVNQMLIDMLTDDTYIDLKRLIARVGTVGVYSNKCKYRWNIPYSKEFIMLMAEELCKQYLIYTGRTKKCIVFDCDNVLWGGILSEDGIEGIRLGSSGLGKEYQDFQRFLLAMHYCGIILAVCSKNDEDDVLRVFHDHSGMLLKKEHIACFQINWNDKSEGIKAIAKKLNVGTDDIVFVDDSFYEIEAVKFMLPDVVTIQYDRELMYNQFSCFNLKRNINYSVIEQRNETYRTNLCRDKLREQCNNLDDFIKSLCMKIDIHKSIPMEYGRISELTQRTNRCTIGKRYTVAEIKEQLCLQDTYFYSVTVVDRFSDLGIVGAMEVCGDALMLFSLSCRALGRNIEQKMLDFIINRHNIRRVEISATGKNEELILQLNQLCPNVVYINAKADN